MGQLQHAGGDRISRFEANGVSRRFRREGIGTASSRGSRRGVRDPIRTTHDALYRPYTMLLYIIVLLAPGFRPATKSDETFRRVKRVRRDDSRDRYHNPNARLESKSFRTDRTVERLSRSTVYTLQLAFRRRTVLFFFVFIFFYTAVSLSIANRAVRSDRGRDFGPDRSTIAFSAVAPRGSHSSGTSYSTAAVETRNTRASRRAKSSDVNA